MKYVLNFLLAVAMLCNKAMAQNPILSVPADASIVVKYSGDNFGKHLPLKKLEGYDFIREDLFQMLRLDTSSSLQQTGIAFEKDIYQYLVTQDSSVSYVTLMQLTSSVQFQQFLKSAYKNANTVVMKNGYTFLPLNNEMYAAWNSTSAVIVSSDYKFQKSYWQSDYYSTAVDSTTTIYSDTAVVIAEEPINDDAIAVKPAPKKTTKKPTTKTTKKPGVNNQKSKKPDPKDKKKKPEEVLEDVLIAAEEMKKDSEEIRRELWDQQQEMIAKNKQQFAADNIAAATFNNKLASIQTNESYRKQVDAGAHISVWLNSGNLLSQNFNYFNRSVYSFVGMARMDADSKQAGFNTAANVYFDKDKVRIEQKASTTDSAMAAIGRDMMNSKQKESLTNYVNPGNIGFLSVSINTEAMMKYYYAVMKQFLAGTYGMSDYADLVNIYIDFLEIAIDEKGLSDLNPGNWLFVMHDLKSKKVNFTDYTYDDDYNRSEVKGVKTEVSPNFTFVMETRREDFLKKLAALPVKYAEKQHFNYADKGGYYELRFDSTEVLDALYFMVKDGKGIITTNKEVIDMATKNISYNVNAEDKKSILDNNYSLRLNSYQLMEALRGELSTPVNKRIMDYMQNNVGDLKMESAYKDGMFQGTTTMLIKGKHANSLEFFFNVIEGVNKIIEDDKTDHEKKHN